MDRHERLCITLLLKNEQELEVTRVMKRGAVGVVGANVLVTWGVHPRRVDRGGEKESPPSYFFFQQTRISKLLQVSD